MQKLTSVIGLILALTSAFAAQTLGGVFSREVSIGKGALIEVKNLSGKVTVSVEAAAAEGEAESGRRMTVQASSAGRVGKDDLKIDASGERARIEVEQASSAKRIDITLIVPARTRLKIETAEGEVRVSGDLESVEVVTETGTIAADVPTDDLKYRLFWTASRPRVVADFELAKVKERAGGRFEIKGSYPNAKDKSEGEKEEVGTDDASEAASDTKPQQKKDDRNAKRVALNFTTDRGIVLLNVPPSEVMSDLRERPLTNAAKAIIRSGDNILMEAIRRASPKYFGDYMRTLPPAKHEPFMAERKASADAPVSTTKVATVRVTDNFNRAIAGLRAEDFEITENGVPREIISVRPVTAPVNLVLLLDVSGSVDNYVNFIRKAARSFVDTMRADDRITIITFNDDVKELTSFTTDRRLLSESLDTFDAGGPTAYYDALAYTLADVLRPLKGERTAIVVLTDGDDNRSFLPFESLIGAIEESGALIYPLYVPSFLIAASNGDLNANIDPVRARYSGLSAKAEGEGERLAKVSGGVYYPISQLSQIQRAYEDIAVQLRTAYSVTFRSASAADPERRASPRLKVKVKKQNTFATIGPVVALSETN